MKIFNIHNHSTYSILDGVGTPEQWAKYISENPDKYAQGLSLSEHGTLNGVIETYDAAKKYGLKYMPSIEVYMNNKFDAGDKKLKRYHLLLFAIDRVGFDQIIAINNLTIRRGQVFKSRLGKRMPIVTPDILEEVVKHNQGHLKVSGACIGGYWNMPIMDDNDIQKSLKHITIIKDIFGAENTYVEYQTYADNTDRQYKVNYANKLFKKKLGLKSIITSDAHVLKQEDLKYQSMATAMAWKTTLKIYLQRGSPHTSTWLKGYDDFLVEMNNTDNKFGLTEDDLKEATQETLNIYSMVENIELHKEQKFLYHNYSEENKQARFKKLVVEGYQNKIAGKIPIEKEPEYKKRIKYEIDILTKKNFIDYFLAVQEIIKKGREEGIVFGVGRGSAAGSIISYLLDITNLDPIEHKLMFERFISENRIDYPDIDVDCSKREQVIDLISRLYPDKDVTVVANKGKFGLKNLMNSIFKTLDIKYPKDTYVASGYYYSDLVDKYDIDSTDIDAYMELDEIKDLVEHLGTTLDLKKLLKIFMQNLFSIGVHAGGVCILPKGQTDVPLTPVANDKYSYGSGYSESGSYRELEFVGQIKFDFLGIRTLRVFESVTRILVESGKKTEQEVKDLLLYTSLDVNQKIIYDRINTTLTEGFFQIGSKGMKQMIANLEPQNVGELAQLIALYRPGPLRAGMDKTMKSVL